MRSAASWLKQPIKTDVDAALQNSRELVVDLVALMKQPNSPKQLVGPVLAQVRSTQKSIENMAMMDWVSVEGGQLAIGHRPGSKMGSDLKLQKTTHILTLLSEGEQAKAIRALAKKNDIEWLWFPMESAQPPEKKRYKELVKLFLQMQSILEKGGKIYLHCSAGIHRTGMISYAFLRYMGNDARSALALLKTLRAKTSESVGEERVAWGDDVVSTLKSYQ